MTKRKAESCYGCPAASDSGCLLGYERVMKNHNMMGYSSIWYVTVYSLKECCYKPKTYKEFTRRLNELRRIKSKS